MIFSLEYADFECSRTYYFEGPESATKEAFEKTCKRLLKPAADLALKETEPDDFLGWGDIILNVCKLLPSHGYEQVKLPTVTYVGSPVIMSRKVKQDGESKGLPRGVRDMIIDHNKKVMKAGQETLEKKLIRKETEI